MTPQKFAFCFISRQQAVERAGQSHPQGGVPLTRWSSLIPEIVAFLLIISYTFLSLTCPWTVGFRTQDAESVSDGWYRFCAPSGTTWARGLTRAEPLITCSCRFLSWPLIMEYTSLPSPIFPRRCYGTQKKTHTLK